MRILGAVFLLLVVVIGAGVLYLNYWAPRPVDVADEYLRLLGKADFTGLEQYYHSKTTVPSPEKFRSAYENFSDAFGLVGTEVVEFVTIKENLHEAEYRFSLKYTSKYFTPMIVQTQLYLAWDGPLKWKVIWQDNLPLPAYGLEATYSRTRIESSRGNIYDRNGQLLAGLGSYITIGVQPDRISDPNRLFTSFEEFLNLSPDYVRKQYEAPGVQGHWFVPLISISESQYAEVDQILRPIPGVFFRREEVRGYPSGIPMGHIVGYMGEVTPEMIRQYPERDYRVGEIVGRSGLENSMEPELRGRPGYQFYVHPMLGGRAMLAERPVIHGADVKLTLDLEMQELAFELLQERLASLVVLNAKTGEVLVLASVPGYDPNEFILGMSSQRWQELSGDRTRPMFNRALQGLYPPGSVFKVITAAAALDQNIYQMDDLFMDTGELRVEGNVVRNFGQQVFREHSFQDAIVKSINTTMARVGLGVGAETLKDYFNRWGLDQQPSLKLPAGAGQIGQPERSKVGLAWTAIGQDRLLLTPFHVASIFTVFANEGRLPKFHIIADSDSAEERQIISSDTVRDLNLALGKVVLEGTGQAAGIADLALGGKTGTAEVGDGVTHAWFAGNVHLEGQDLAFALLVEDSGVGGSVAAPLINQYFSRLMQ